MHLDVVDLRAFYYRTKLGRTVKREMQSNMRRVWPSTAGEVVLGVGFAHQRQSIDRVKHKTTVSFTHELKNSRSLINIFTAQR